MSDPTNSLSASDLIAQAAAAWTVRHDRGLSATEQDEFSAWLASDPRHRAAWAEHRWGWEELDRLAGLQTSMHAAPDADLLRPARSRRLSRHWRQGALLASVFAIAAAVFFRPQHTPAPATQSQTPRSLALIEQRTLSDGSMVALNRGTVITELFTGGERRVRLDQGEAHFTVVKNAARPFVVEAGGVAVRAVGTAFNVRIESALVEVLVTEGRVAVRARPIRDPASTHGGQSMENWQDASPGDLPATDNPTFVNAGERTVVSFAQSLPSPQVTAVSPAEIEARLAWQPRMLDFTGAPLSEIVAAFNLRNPVRLRLGDPSLGKLRLSATFRSDNVEGFVRLMELDFGMRADWSANELVLNKTGR